MAAFFDGRAGVAGGCTFGARDEATLVADRCGLGVWSRDEMVRVNFEG